MFVIPALEKDRQEDDSSATQEVQGLPVLREKRWGRREGRKKMASTQSKIRVNTENENFKWLRE